MVLSFVERDFYDRLTGMIEGSTHNRADSLLGLWYSRFKREAIGMAVAERNQARITRQISPSGKSTCIALSRPSYSPMAASARTP